MQFILYKTKNIIDDDKILEIKKMFWDRTTLITEHEDYEWISKDKKTLFLGRNPKISFYEKYNTFHINKNHELKAIHGWTKKYTEDKLLPANNITTINDLEMDGYYALFNLNNKGIGTIHTSLFSPQLYYAKNNDGYAISNRISILSKLFGYETPNKNHLASHIQFLHDPITFETIYENIEFIPDGSKIYVKSDLEIGYDYDFCYDKFLNDLYKSNPKSYWDQLYKNIKSQIDAFINLGIKDNLIVNIDDGKNSRLLLSLWHEHLEKTFTLGHAYSPEVIIGHMIAKELNLKHEIPDLKNNSSSKNMLEKIPIHLFTCEFEMNPWDLEGLPSTNSNQINVDGQDFIKTKPYISGTYEEILTHQKNYYLNNEKEIIPKEEQDLVASKHINFTENLLSNMNDVRKYPYYKKILSKGRWGSKVHDTIFNQKFSIYPLFTNSFVKYSFNVSPEAMKNSELEYELLSRSCPELLDIPLFNEKYVQNPIPPVENKIPSKINYNNLYLVKYFDFIKKYIIDNYIFISDIVKKSFIENLTKENVKNNEMLSQQLYNILQAIIFLKEDDFSNMKKTLDIEYGYSIEKEESTYDEDYIEAIVKYNEDIVKLKEKEELIEEQINTLNVLKQNMINHRIIILKANNQEIINVIIKNSLIEIPSGFNIINEIDNSVIIQNKENLIEINYFDLSGSGNLETVINEYKNIYSNYNISVSEVNINNKKIQKTVAQKNNSSYIDIRYWFVNDSDVFNIKPSKDSEENFKTMASIISAIKSI